MGNISETTNNMPETIIDMVDTTNNMPETTSNVSETSNNVSVLEKTNKKLQTIRRIRPRPQVIKVTSMRPFVSKSRSRSRQATTSTPLKETNKRKPSIRTKPQRLSSTTPT